MTTATQASESVITIQLVHSGYILSAPSANNGYKTEVFTSTAKLNKAVRAAIEEFTLVAKKADDAAE